MRRLAGRGAPACSLFLGKVWKSADRSGASPPRGPDNFFVLLLTYRVLKDFLFGWF